MPENWRSAEFLGPPGPASEYAHNRTALARADRPRNGTPEAAWRQFHEDISHQHCIGVDTVSKKPKKGDKEEIMRVTDWSLQALAGTPCVAILMTRFPRALSIVVRGHCCAGDCLAC